MTVATVLPVVWFGIIGFAILMYVLLDGFVLGIGILAPFGDDEAQRELMMSTAAPIWDGNETWLVMGGAGLMAAFPKAYATILPGLYLPILLMLVALIFRGVAFEFRFRAGTTRWIWASAFHLGSLLATFMQGLMLGALVQGLPPAGRAEPAGIFAWLSPFSVFTGIALVFGYALLGSAWLGLKTSGRAQEVAHRLTLPAMLAVIAGMVAVSAWLPFLAPRIMARWFTWPRFLYLSPLPLATGIAAICLWRAVRANRELATFLWSMGLFILGFAGLVIGMWPNIVPPTLSIWAAASPPSSQGFVLVGAAVMIPVVLFYTAFSYRVFRGKLKAGTSFYR